MRCLGTFLRCIFLALRGIVFGSGSAFIGLLYPECYFALVKRTRPDGFRFRYEYFVCVREGEGGFA